MVNINIPLPVSCASCPLSVRHFGKLYCPPLNDRVGNEGKDSRCPLVDADDHLAEVSKKGDMISRQALLRQIDIDADGEPGYYGDTWKFIDTIKRMPSAQLDVPDINVGDINKFIDGLVEIFADIRESNVDDSVCGLCEFDGAYIGESGDWCNECPGFNRDDCFKLRDGIRKKWIAEITACMPTAQPGRRPYHEEWVSALQTLPEIIRCKDCKHQTVFHYTDKRFKDPDRYVYGCDLMPDGCYLNCFDSYCSEAERRTDE